jgi:hypothetical protein
VALGGASWTPLGSGSSPGLEVVVRSRDIWCGKLVTDRGTDLVVVHSGSNSYSEPGWPSLLPSQVRDLSSSVLVRVYSCARVVRVMWVLGGVRVLHPVAGVFVLLQGGVRVFPSVIPTSTLDGVVGDTRFPLLAGLGFLPTLLIVVK